MPLEIQLKQSQQQTLLLSPQLRQAIQLLQLSRVDYAQALQAELLSNPLLVDLKAEPADSDWRAARNSDRSERSAEFPSGGSGSEGGTSFRQSGGQSGQSHSQSDFIERDFEYGSAPCTSASGMLQHLGGQIQFLDLSHGEKQIALKLVGEVNRDGFIEAPLDELAIAYDCTLETLETIREEVQLLDPVGICSLSMSECLVVQLRNAGYGNSLAEKLVAGFLPQLADGKLKAVASELGVANEDISEALLIVKNLTPFPGRAYSEEQTSYIEPDVYVVEQGDEFEVRLNLSGMPELSLNAEYLLLKEQAEKGSAQEAFLEARLKSAEFFVRSIEQRKLSILKTMRSILRYQIEFFREGPLKLKPLVLREVAEDVGMHESTISRITSNKYVHTPRGIFELKYFFSSAISSNSGDMAAEAVKQRIKELITGELKPLSDQRLADVLAAEGIQIARRTVAKYREGLGIATAKRRRRAALV